MLVFDKKLNGMPVASIQQSRPVGSVVDYLIDPRNLKMVALYVGSRLSPDPLVLHTTDIKEFTPAGIVIDHDQQLMETEGLVRLQEIIDINFVLLDKPVITEDGRKLGKVIAFVIETESWFIVKIHVRQPLIKNVSTAELIIHRQQIVKVTDSQILVKSTAIKSDAGFSLRRLFFGSAKPALTPDSTQPTTRT